jgi:aspartate carbamoyltransferase regulatory subunit
MSEYFDNKDLFLQPKVTQHGSLMVMTNVHKDRKKKYINIDTRFSDEPNTVPQLANHTITLPERITDVKSIYITNVEIPDVLYNISALQNNNCLTLTKTSTNTKYVITITDNKYGKITDLHTELNTKIQTATGDNNITVSLNSSSKTQIVSTTNTYTMNFSVDSNGNFDRALLNSKLGWVLGFRNTTYTVNSVAKIAEALPDIFGPKYIYLAIDEFSHSNKRSFISPLSSSLINKNIISRISISTVLFGFNNLISANRADGSMVSDKREYNSKVDIQKLNVQILNEYGNPVCLNGLDFSFCMEVEHQ